MIYQKDSWSVKLDWFNFSRDSQENCLGEYLRLKASLAGHEIAFLVDSCSPKTFLPKALLQQYGIDDNMLKEPEYSKQVTFPACFDGTLRFSGLDFPVRFGVYSSANKFDMTFGILGMDFLKTHHCSVDLRHRHGTSPRLVGRKSGKPVLGYQHKLTVDVVIARCKKTALFDTGSPVSLMPRVVAKELGLHIQTSPTAFEVDNFGKIYQITDMVTVSLGIGNIQLKDHKFFIMESDQFIIGNQTLKYFDYLHFPSYNNAKIRETLVRLTPGIQKNKKPYNFKKKSVTLPPFPTPNTPSLHFESRATEV